MGFRWVQVRLSRDYQLELVQLVLDQWDHLFEYFDFASRLMEMLENYCHRKKAFIRDLLNVFEHYASLNQPFVNPWL